MYLTVFTGNDPPFSVNLEEYKKRKITFGRSSGNDLVLRSQIVSSSHGFFTKEGERWKIADNHSTNGLYVNEEPVTERLLSDGLKIYIGDEKHSERVVFLCTVANNSIGYRHFSLEGREKVLIGRQEDCDIRLGYVGVSRVHGSVIRKKEGFCLSAAGSGQIRYNGRPLGRTEKILSPMDRFMIGDTQFLYREGELIYYRSQDGLGMEISGLTKTVPAGRGKKTILSQVSLQIQPGEFTAIVGGSGAGKSTLLKCISGCTEYTEGSVLIQGEDIRSGYESIRRLMGYVPQQDIVYDDLTLEKMLYYSAGLRMPRDASRQEIRERIREVIHKVELDGHEKTMIRKLSGGQKKRASIAVELLSDPGIFFLDEPTSGLDPGTEQKLMRTLKKMTETGKTIVLVTHTPLNLHLCDKIIFMGPGGKLCFCGSPGEAVSFFQVDRLVDIYNLVQEAPEVWEAKYRRTQYTLPVPAKGRTQKEKEKASVFRQIRLLTARCLEITVNDRKRFLLQLLMAPGLGILLYLAFSGSLEPFVLARDTETFSIALACCCFWIGLFQAIQEICKERTIMERERMAGLKMPAYFFSKAIVLGGFLILQCFLLLGCVWVLIGSPKQGALLGNAAFLEYLLLTCLTAFSAAAMGLLLSAAVSTPEQASAAAPLLLIPQILFSEIICTLSGAAKYLSYIVSCKWTCLGYCASAGINDLPSKLMPQVEYTFYNSRYSAFKLPVLGNVNPAAVSIAALILLTALLSAATLLALRKRREL